MDEVRSGDPCERHYCDTAILFLAVIWRQHGEIERLTEKNAELLERCGESK